MKASSWASLTVSPPPWSERSRAVDCWSLEVSAARWGLRKTDGSPWSAGQKLQAEAESVKPPGETVKWWIHTKQQNSRIRSREDTEQNVSKLVFPEVWASSQGHSMTWCDVTGGCGFMWPACVYFFLSVTPQTHDAQTYHSHRGNKGRRSFWACGHNQIIQDWRMIPDLNCPFIWRCKCAGWRAEDGNTRENKQ